MHTPTFSRNSQPSTNMLKTFSSTTIFLSLLQLCFSRGRILERENLCSKFHDGICRQKRRRSSFSPLSSKAAGHLFFQRRNFNNFIPMESPSLGSDICSWFSSQSTALCEDLENLLHESLLFTFNTEIEDGSIEEVAEQLMVLHEEILARESLIRYYDC